MKDNLLYLGPSVFLLASIQKKERSKKKKDREWKKKDEKKGLTGEAGLNRIFKFGKRDVCTSGLEMRQRKKILRLYIL